MVRGGRRGPGPGVRAVIGSLGMGDFNGLDVHLGNVARLSTATTWSISAENRDGSKGGGARATEGTYSRQAREAGLGWKMSPCIAAAGRVDHDAGRDRGLGRDHAHLDDGRQDPLALADAADVLGRRGDAVDRGTARRLLLQWLG